LLTTLPPLARAARLGDETAVARLLVEGHDARQADEHDFSA
jgi:hypothetical protein